MNLEKILSERISKPEVDKIVTWIGDNAQRFVRLMRIFFTGDGISANMSAWVMSEVVLNETKLITPYIPQLLERVNEAGIHDAIKRNIFRILQEYEARSEEEGLIYDTAMRFFTTMNEAIAVRVFAMSTAARIAKKYPELKEELLHLIQSELEMGESKPAYISRAKATIRFLSRA